MASRNAFIHIHLEEQLYEVICHPHTTIWKGSLAPTLENTLKHQEFGYNNFRGKKNKLPLPLLWAGQKEKQIVVDKMITGHSRDREWELR